MPVGVQIERAQTRSTVAHGRDDIERDGWHHVVLPTAPFPANVNQTAVPRASPMRGCRVSGRPRFVGFGRAAKPHFLLEPRQCPGLPGSIRSGGPYEGTSGASDRAGITGPPPTGRVVAPRRACLSRSPSRTTASFKAVPGAARTECPSALRGCPRVGHPSFGLGQGSESIGEISSQGSSGRIGLAVSDGR